MLSSDHIRIDPAKRDDLRARGLLRVDEILSRVDGRVVAWSRSTDTLHVPGDEGRPGFYLKRYRYSSWRKRIRTMFRGTFFGKHRGQAEFTALRTMRALGIAVTPPIAHGARRIGHFVSACFLITEEVPNARNLTTFARDVAAGRQHLSRSQRQAMIDGLAQQVARMHAAGFSHGQLFWRNILVRLGDDGSPEFFLLDAQPIPRWRRLGAAAAWWRRELANLTVSALPFTTRAERLRFLRRYLRCGRLTPENKSHARTIDTLSQRWQRHETQRVKMNDLFEEWNRQLAREPATEQTAAAGVTR